MGYLIFNISVLSNHKTQKPYLFFSIEINEGVLFNFFKFTAEVTILQENGVILQTEEVYEYVRVGSNKNNSSLSNVYILNINKQKLYMPVQFQQIVIKLIGV